MNDFVKLVLPCETAWMNGRGEQRLCPVYCEIRYLAGKLAITGVEGPLSNGDCRGGCGQINDRMGEPDYVAGYGKGWDKAMYRRFLAIWDAWHLNNMRAGTPLQERFAAEYKMLMRARGERYEYTGACAYLDDRGVLVDGDYAYGSKWLSEPVPERALSFLLTLPDAPTPLPGEWGHSYERDREKIAAP